MPDAMGKPVVFISDAHEGEAFDLNDIEHEPTDEQLARLMADVAAEARYKAEKARAELMARLRSEIAVLRPRISNGTSIARERP